MGRKKNKGLILHDLLIEEVTSEGNALARHEGKVIFVKHAVPGDRVTVRLLRSRKQYAEAEILEYKSYSSDRVEAVCSHFGLCGGCSWQMLPYDLQLQYKQKQVEDNFRHIGKLEFPPLMPILGSARTEHYRNKLEFTFSRNLWLTREEIARDIFVEDKRAVGYHIPKRFDKIFQVDVCHLMDDLQNQIRKEVDAFSREQQYTYYDLVKQEGFIRNLMLRNASTNEWMVVVIFGYEDIPEIQKLMAHLVEKFPDVTTWQYVINTKLNSSIQDLDVIHFAGKPYLTEKLENLSFKISAKSFFQTNSEQTQVLYQVAREFAALSGTERVYDLYTGTGTIACFVAAGASEVVGIEYVEKAIEDARENAANNGLNHLKFFAGDMKDVLTPDFIATHGAPDVIITDPPRAGMHTDVIERMLECNPERIVYISCNPATQARDLSFMTEKYSIEKVQPVDMFPHTHHVENVVLLKRKVTENP